MSTIIFILFLSTIASAITIELHFKGENVSIISQTEQMKLKKSISNIFILTDHQEINKINNFFNNLHVTRLIDDVFIEDNIVLDHRSIYYTILCQLVCHKDIKNSTKKSHDLEAVR